MEISASKEYLKQGGVYAGQGKYEDALVYYEKAAREDPMDIEVYLSMGIAYANLEKYDQAEEQFRKALKINRNSGITYYHLGSIAILKNDISAGVEYYNKAISNGYDDAQLYFSLGLLHEERGDYELAVRNYSKGILRDPLRPDIRIRKAQLLMQGGHIPEALQTLDEMILTNPDTFEGYHMKFTLLIQLRQYDAAEKLIADARALFPEDLGFAMDLVVLRTEQHRDEEALKLLSQLESANAEDDGFIRRCHMQRAQILAGKSDLDGAISELQDAKALSEKNGQFDSEVVFLLANCYLANNRFSELLVCAEDLLAKSDDGYHKETARYFRPLALDRVGRKEESAAAYKEAIEEYRRHSLENPGDLDAYLLRAMCLKDTGSNEKALELVDFVIGLHPEKPEPRILRASILQAMGRQQEAEEETKRANDLVASMTSDM